MPTDKADGRLQSADGSPPADKRADGPSSLPLPAVCCLASAGASSSFVFFPRLLPNAQETVKMVPRKRRLGTV